MPVRFHQGAVPRSEEKHGLTHNLVCAVEFVDGAPTSHGSDGMNSSESREMPSEIPEDRGESPETGARQMKVGQGSQIHAVKSEHALNLYAYEDIP